MPRLIEICVWYRDSPETMHIINYWSDYWTIPFHKDSGGFFKPGGVIAKWNGVWIGSIDNKSDLTAEDISILGDIIDKALLLGTVSTVDISPPTVKMIASIGDHKALVDLSVSPGAGGSSYELTFDGRHYGRFIQRKDGWHFTSNTNTLTIDDIQILIEILEDVW